MKKATKSEIDRLIVVGVSAGGVKALLRVLSQLSPNISAPILINQHLPADRPSNLDKILQASTTLTVKEVDDKDILVPKTVYIAPPAYHLHVEKDHKLSLSVDELENYARPSADVLFESASIAFGEKVVGIILTGASADGAKGLLSIQDRGGTVMVQSPEEAEFKEMPLAAIRLTKTRNILSLDEIIKKLNRLESTNAKI